MAAKKSSKKTATINKSAFVRSLPASMSGADVVAKAKAQGVKISLAYVYGIRAKSNAKKRGGSVAIKRGPGRPRKATAVATTDGGVRANGGSKANGAGGAHRTGVGGLVAEIERIVEAKVAELLKSRLGTIFS